MVDYFLEARRGGGVISSSREFPVIIAFICWCSEVLSLSESSQSICFRAFIANSCTLWAFHTFCISLVRLDASLESSALSDSKTCTRELTFSIVSVWLLFFSSLRLRLTLTRSSSLVLCIMWVLTSPSDSSSSSSVAWVLLGRMGESSLFLILMSGM